MKSSGHEVGLMMSLNERSNYVFTLDEPLLAAIKKPNFDIYKEFNMITGKGLTLLEVMTPIPNSIKFMMVYGITKNEWPIFSSFVHSLVIDDEKNDKQYCSNSE